jgi:transglutaminase-like putative cysteine protease
MRIKIGYDIAFDLPGPTPILLMLRVRPEVEPQLTAPECLRIEPEMPVSEYFDVYGNRVGRIMAPAGRLRIRNEALIEVDGRPDSVVRDASQRAIADLPPEVIQFLLGSRYCEVDRLGELAWNLFSKSEPGWPRVQAVCDWVHNHLQFGYQYARPTKTAYDAYVEGNGVCRDFAHLAITLCRCLNIPARYTTGYLGDIGVPPVPDPMDFSGWFEAYLGGRWYTFDARHNKPRIGRIVMAYGRDATDVALTTAFGPCQLHDFKVVTDEVTDPVAS